MVGVTESESVRITPKHLRHISEPYWSRALVGVGWEELRMSIYNSGNKPELISWAVERWAKQVGVPVMEIPKTTRIEDELARLRGDLVQRGR